jgi:competence protein ComGF
MGKSKKGTEEKKVVTKNKKKNNINRKGYKKSTKLKGTLSEDKIESSYIKKWEDVITCTTPGDMVHAEKVVYDFYKSMDYDTPKKVFILDSPVQGALIASKLLEDGVTLKDVEKIIDVGCYEKLTEFDLSNCFMGSSEGYWVGYYDMLSTEEDEVMPDGYAELRELCYHTSAYFTLNDCAIICKKPTVIKTNDKGYHSYQGPSIEFVDGTEIFVINGTYQDKDNWLVKSAPYRCSVGRMLYGEKD